MRVGVTFQQTAPPSSHDSLSPAWWHFLQQPFNPFFSHSLGKGQSMAVLRPEQEVGTGAGGAQGCRAVCPISPVRADRRGQTLSVWTCQSVSLCPASIPAQLSDQVSASPEPWQRTRRVCKQPRAVNKRKNSHSIEIQTRLAPVDFGFVDLVFKPLHCSFEASEFFNGCCWFKSFV